MHAYLSPLIAAKVLEDRRRDAATAPEAPLARSASGRAVGQPDRLAEDQRSAPARATAVRRRLRRNTA